MSLDLSSFTLLPIQKATSPPAKDGTFQIYTNRYWEVYNKNLLFYNGSSPQCNRDKKVVEKMGFKYGTEIVFLEKVFVEFSTTMDLVGYPTYKIITE
jgi:hypothetical protein